MDALEEFHADRMAGRILGMGDMLSLVEQAQEKFDQEELQKQEERLKKGQFTLDDFKKMLGQTKKLGPLNKVMGMIPGMGNMADMMGDVDAEKDMKRLVGVIDSMTPSERSNPKKTIDQSRRRRIAEGAGVQPHEVNDLVKQFDVMSDMMKRMSNMGVRDRMKMMREMASGGMNGGLSKKKGSTGKRLSPKEKAKLRKQREKEKRKKKRGSKK
jgi:signal recognition particle subunit SRP54